MEALVPFAATVAAVSVSGALAPGPLLAAGIALGMRGGGMRAGVLLAIGHAAVELPLVIALGAGIMPLGSVAGAHATVSALGAAGLFAFAAIHARSTLGSRRRATGQYLTGTRGALVTGAALSAINPFFWAWWATVGLKLVTDSTDILSSWGPPALFALHIPMDIVWLAVVAALARRGSTVMQGRVRRATDIALVATMAGIGVLFALEAIRA